MKSIDLLSFLQNYYGIANPNLKLNRLSHKDIKTLFPNIKRTSVEYLNNNLSEVYNGNLVLVHDCKGMVLPYINPRLEIVVEYSDYDEYEEEMIIDINNIDLNGLSKEELLKLRSKLKRNHQNNDEKSVVRAIRRKKDYNTMKYKREKRLLRLED